MSLKKKLQRLNDLGLYLAYDCNNEHFTADELDEVYSVADGLTEEMILNNFDCKCSIANILPVEKLDCIIQDKMKKLENIVNKYDL